MTSPINLIYIAKSRTELSFNSNISMDDRHTMYRNCERVVVASTHSVACPQGPRKRTVCNNQTKPVMFKTGASDPKDLINFITVGKDKQLDKR